MNIEDFTYYLRRLWDDPSRLVKVITSRNSRLILLNLFWEMKMEEFVRSTIYLSSKEWRKFDEEIRGDAFVKDLSRRYLEVRRVALGRQQMWHKMVYIILRKLKPSVVIETGVFDGVSSAYILQALHKNRKGYLVSIDRPAVREIKGSTDEMHATYLPLGCKPGWIVPQSLRDRWHLVLGSSKGHLEQVLSKKREVDVFIHDSLHTYQNMMWEYKTVWPKISKGGYLCSDDIFCNRAFEDWCNMLDRKVRQKGSFGIIKK